MKKKKFALIIKSQNNIKTGMVHVCSVQKGNYNWKNLNCNWYTKLIELCTNIVQTGFMRSMQSDFLPSLMEFQKLNRAVLTFGGMLHCYYLVCSSNQAVNIFISWILHAHITAPHATDALKFCNWTSCYLDSEWSVYLAVTSDPDN